MVDAFETPKEVVAVTEFVKGGDLNKVVNANKSDQQVSVNYYCGVLSKRTSTRALEIRWIETSVNGTQIRTYIAELLYWYK